MTVASNHKVKRFDVACALESAFKHHDWKGDDHYKGVFFTDTKGYCVNKILAIRIEHEEKAPDVFYSFAAKNIDEKVMIEYPFSAMDMKPKKHHLLSERKELRKKELDSLFGNLGDCDEFKIAGHELFGILEENVPSKRERDRTQVQLIRRAEDCRMEIVRHKKHEKEVIAKKELPITDYQFIEEEKIMKVAKLNANSLYTVLQLFPTKSEVSFCISRDRIKITGNLSTLEGRKAAVEVVLSQMKG